MAPPSGNSSRTNDGLNFAFPAATEPTPFDISVDQEFIQRTIEKVRTLRPTIALQDEQEWEEGPPTTKINEIAQHWGEKYDWNKVQDGLNSKFKHFATTVDGGEQYPHPVPLHFIHERAQGKDGQDPAKGKPIPLLLLHGWPSTSLLFAKVIHELAHPSDPTQPRFDVVVPDIPGYGFSPAPTHTGFGFVAAGHAFNALMKQLGYTKYGLISTDIGWRVAMHMTSSHHKESIIAHFTDFFIAQPTPDDLARLGKGETTEEENKYMGAAQEYWTNHFGYALLHGHRPLSLAVALSDSPIGFLTWIYQILAAVGDGYQYGNDELITTTMVLWIQGTVSQLRMYGDLIKKGNVECPKGDVPTGVVVFSSPDSPYKKLENMQDVPRAWAERTANVTFFRQHPKGGHFPAITQPEQWLEGVRDFFTQEMSRVQ